MEQLFNFLSQRQINILGYDTFGKYAILLPLIKKENEWNLVLEIRSSQLKHQPGEICFPGGKFEEMDKTFERAAIREACEELGIEENHILRIMGIDYFISPYGKIIYPFVAVLDENTTFHINEEVEEIFFVPLTYIDNYSVKEYQIELKVQPEKDFPYDKIVGGQNYRWQTRKATEYFYEYDNKTIWGLTARILKHFLDLYKKTTV